MGFLALKLRGATFDQSANVAKLRGATWIASDITAG
jgi:hypothetical protein